MRGTEEGNVMTIAEERITPAHAGNSSQLRISIVGKWDHPRTCGEQSGAAMQ